MVRLTLALIAITTISVNAQIDELKSASDKAEAVLNNSSSHKSPIQYVNPFIGTGGHGHTYPGASAPFGMMQLSPDTRYDGWDGCSGYHYSDSIIYGFSHTHLSGTGVPDYNDLLIIPQVGKPKIDPGYLVDNGYGAEFSHSNEKAEPGYYEVKLEDPDIDVQLATTERAGIHQYTFNEKKGKKFILLDLDHRDKLINGEFTIHDNRNISGFRISQAWANEQHFYFHLSLSRPYQKARVISQNGRHKLLLIFPKKTDEVTIKVGMSAVDENGAYQNLASEIPNWSIDEVKTQTQSKWLNELSQIRFSSKDEEIMTNFYTALYHSYLCPNIFSDVDGRYRGRDLQIHQLSTTETYYTLFSLWDTYRATHPLFTITQQDRTRDFINTFMLQYQQGGDLPVWELAANETECMIGYHSVSVMSDAISKGINTYPVDQIISAAIATSNFDEFGKKEFGELGFIPLDKESESVSKTLEYSYDDFCIYQMIKSINIDNKEHLSQEYLNRSFNFVNLYDPSTKFMRARRGAFKHAPFDPAEVNFNYTEANSWQYSLYAPHAIGVLTDLIGGKDSLERWLDNLFSTSSELEGRHQVDITGLIGQYAHGNEPSHHMAYLYNYTDAPWKTQLYIDSIHKTFYTNEPDGLSGNEDCGQMSSWYVLSALGLYQVAPSNPYYEFGRPLMDKATIKLESGKTLKIIARNNAKNNKYLQKVLWNGKVLDARFISHATLMQGGKLEFIMGSERLNYSDNSAPTLSELPESFVPAPFIQNEERFFDDVMFIELGINNPDDYLIYFTTDGSDPKTSNSSRLYTIPFEVNKTTELKIFAKNDKYASSTVSNTLIKRDNSVHVELNCTYDNQYAANGEFTFVDGVKGSTDFRTGDWQGFWDQNFDAIITFDEVRNLSEIEIGFLSDMKSWVFLPEQVKFEISYNGTDFEEVETINVALEQEKDMYPHVKRLTTQIDNTKPIKAIRIQTISVDKCPEWHLGVGSDTWFFVDEISFQ